MKLHNLASLAVFVVVAMLTDWRGAQAEGDASSAAKIDVQFEPVFGGRIFERPIFVTHAGDGTGRLFVMGQLGEIWVCDGPDDDSPEVFLDIRSKVEFNENKNEEGLLGLAFHPRFKDNGELYVYYSPRYEEESERRTVVSRFRVPAGENRGDPDSEEQLLSINQPFWNHNGGTVVFGPDGMLYIAVGDGGAYGDPKGNAQDTQTLLGAVLRIDVDESTDDRPYGIPSDNPFAGRPEAGRPEIWAYGLRNVWRMAFDAQTGKLWAGDVGQNIWEEIDVLRPGGNYGWNLREGFHPYVPNDKPDQIPPGYPSGKTAADFANVKFDEPVWEYHHDEGKSITGGVVYRGKLAPELNGWYLYADYVSGAIYALDTSTVDEEEPTNRVLRAKGLAVTSFGEGPDGEAYIMETTGKIHRISTISSSQAAQEYYELRIYRLDDPAQQGAVAAYLESALLPALGRMGLDRIGVFRPLEGAGEGGSSDVYVLIPYPDLEAFANLNRTLAADKAYQKAAADFFEAPKDKPAYRRIESRFMKAFAGIPRIEQADFMREKRQRVFELRTYESHQTDRARMKVAMFNDGEIDVMRDSDLAPVFYGETLIGANVPNLTYMLAAESVAEHKQHFQDFIKHPGWIAMKDLPIYEDTVSRIESVMLEPLDSSQL